MSDAPGNRLFASLVVGAVIGVLTVGILGTLWYVSRRGSAEVGRTDAANVVVAFVSPAQDGATIAQIVVLLTDTATTQLLPETTVTVPGTSLVPLSDAYPFGGGGALAAGVASIEDVNDPAYVVIPQRTWTAAVDANSGLAIEVVEDVSVFDGRTVVRVASGEQRLDGTQIAAVMRALPYLESRDRELMRDQLQKGLTEALAKNPPGFSAVETDLDAQTYANWSDSVLFKTTSP